MEQVVKHALREPTWILQEPLEKQSQTAWRAQKVKCHVVLARSSKRNAICSSLSAAYQPLSHSDYRSEQLSE